MNTIIHTSWTQFCRPESVFWYLWNLCTKNAGAHNFKKKNVMVSANLENQNRFRFFCVHYGQGKALKKKIKKLQRHSKHFLGQNICRYSYFLIKSGFSQKPYYVHCFWFTELRPIMSFGGIVPLINIIIGLRQDFPIDFYVIIYFLSHDQPLHCKIINTI